MSINGVGSGSYYNSIIYSSRNRQSLETGNGQQTQKGKSQESQIASVINKLDEDGSGGISSSELSSLVSKVNQLTGQSLDVESLFSSFDDGDGELSVDETKAVLESIQPQGPPAFGRMEQGGRLEEIISAADEDSDGVLSDSELESIASMITNVTGTETSVSDLISGYDEDGDGSLNTDEALAALEANKPDGPPAMSTMNGGAPPSLEELVASADTDSDGVLTETELEGIADMISKATGEDMTAADLISLYGDEDATTLTTDQVLTALEENRPEGAPPMMGLGGPSPLSDIFTAADEDDDGSLSTTETESLVKMINNVNGSDITAADLIAEYDTDDDGLLNQDETVAALEANRPDRQAGQVDDSQSMHRIDQYMRVASMGGLFSQTEDGTTSSFLGVNTKA